LGSIVRLTYDEQGRLTAVSLIRDRGLTIAQGSALHIIVAVPTPKRQEAV